MIHILTYGREGPVVTWSVHPAAVPLHYKHVRLVEREPHLHLQKSGLGMEFAILHDIDLLVYEDLSKYSKTHHDDEFGASPT